LKVYNKKIVVSGDVVEVYTYSKAQYKTDSDKGKNNKSSASGKSFNEKIKSAFKTLFDLDRQLGFKLDFSAFTDLFDAFKDNYLSEQEEYKKKNSYKRKRSIRRLINANSDELRKFFTLTFKENVQDVDKAYYEFKKFKRRLKYFLRENYNHELKYVVVIEFQERGAVHFHMLCNLPFIKSEVLQEIWSNGFIKINKIDDVDNVGSYVVKYMGKDFEDDRLEGRKRYNRSRNLKEPEEIIEKKKVAELLAQLPEDKLVYENNFDNEYLGSVHYQQFNISR